MNTMRRNSNKFTINETLYKFSASASRIKHSKYLLRKLFYLLRKISIRDTFELSIEMDGHERTVIDSSNQSLQEIILFYEQNKEENENLTIDLIINKNLKNKKISIYSLSSFSSFFNSNSVLDKINILAGVFDDVIYFEVFEPIKIFGSNTIKFIPYDSGSSENTTPEDVKLRSSVFSRFQDNSNLMQLRQEFLPEDFFCSNHDNSYRDFFSKAKLLYSLAFIANSTELIEDEFITFKVNGYKTISTEKRTPEKFTEDSDIAYKIYEWVYSEGQCSDKIGLVRNIITLESDSNTISLTTSTWRTIQANYSIYLRENIGKYLDLKSKLLEYITEFNKRALEATDSFTSSFQSNTIGFTTFIVTVVAVNGIKDSGADKIFSKEYILIALIICAVSTLWMLISKSDTDNRIRYLIEQTKSSIIRSYSNILSIDEVNESIDPTIEKIKTHTNQRIKKYRNLWTISTLTFLFLFVAGYLISDPTPLKTDTPCKTVEGAKNIINFKKLRPNDYL